MAQPFTQKQLSAYSYGAIWLHWLLALAIFAQLAAGFAMMHIAAIPDHARFLMFQWHKTVGVLILLLTLARIAWRLMNRPPEKAPMLRVEKLVAGVVSFLFYVLMLAVPLTGWVLVSASPTQIPTRLFLITGLIWPNLPVTPGAALEEMAANAHAVLAYSFLFLLFLHVGGALKHSIIDHVPEISRMLPTGRLPHQKAKKLSATIAVLVFLAAGAGGLLPGQYPASRPTGSDRLAKQSVSTEQSATTAILKPNWIIDHSQSSLTYQLDFAGTAQNGAVASWKATIQFDPASPEAARAEIIIDADSVSYDESFVADSLSQKDGLDSADYPQIHVFLDQFTKEQDSWLATGMITIRSVSRPIALHFTYREKDGRASVSGKAEIDRLAFGIGKDNDPDGTWLGKTVHIKIRLLADKN